MKGYPARHDNESTSATYHSANTIYHSLSPGQRGQKASENRIDVGTYFVTAVDSVEISIPLPNIVQFASRRKITVLSTRQRKKKTNRDLLLSGRREIINFILYFSIQNYYPRRGTHAYVQRKIIVASRSRGEIRTTIIRRFLSRHNFLLYSETSQNYYVDGPFIPRYWPSFRFTLPHRTRRVTIGGG